MTYIRDNLILLWASPKTAGNFVEDVLDKSSLSEIYGPVDIECSLTSGECNEESEINRPEDKMNYAGNNKY